MARGVKGWGVIPAPGTETQTVAVMAVPGGVEPAVSMSCEE